MTFKKAGELEIAVAKALGLDAKQISKLILVLEADSVPRVRVDFYLFAEQVDELVRVFELATFEPQDC